LKPPMTICGVVVLGVHFATGAGVIILVIALGAGEAIMYFYDILIYGVEILDDEAIAYWF